jgi:hemolysin activation/secretion protein
VAFNNADAGAADALTRNSAGGFAKTSFAFSRAQGLDAANTLLFTFSGQWARKNLDASQKFSLGGANSVRAYEGGVLSGDSGQFASMELRHSLAPDTTSTGTWRTTFFVDAGQVQINQTPWGSGSNQAYISGAGVGLDWQSSAKWHARMYIARALAPAPSQLEGSAATHSNAWMEIGLDF